jgi:HD-GYP domain-containing protein (c-di-GMP phosphodiesterase class II)
VPGRVARTSHTDDAPPLFIAQVGLDVSNLQFVETMAQALDARDPYTAGHSIRVGAYADAIARALRVPSDEIETLRIAAQLHDIGKIGVPDAILLKCGPLTSDEFAVIKLHPQIGRRILEKVAQFDSLLPVVELHHENHDGSGYPHHLSGERIPLFARIVHVADAFDSMMTNRSYRGALTLGATIEQLHIYAGTQFDPLIAAAMIDLVHQGKHNEIAEPADWALVLAERAKPQRALVAE